MGKETTQLRPVSAQQEQNDGTIEGEISKIVHDLEGIGKARDAVEQKGIAYHNQTVEMYTENDERLVEVDRAISAEEDLIHMGEQAITQMQAMIKEHGANLAKLKIERQGRLDLLHYLKSHNISG